jgi:molybdate transport system permease protein
LTLTQDIVSALQLSLLCGLVAIALSLIPAGLLAIALARYQFRGKALVELLLFLPIVLPPVVIGYLLLRLLSHRAFPGSLLARIDFDIVFTWWGAALAQAVIAFPILVVTLRAAFSSVDGELESAAYAEGANRWQVFRYVTAPMAWPGVAGGCTLALSRALGEFGATVIVAGNIAGQTRTLPLAIANAAQVPGQEQKVMLLVVVSIALAVASLAIYRLCLWRGSHFA